MTGHNSNTRSLKIGRKIPAILKLFDGDRECWLKANEMDKTFKGMGKKASARGLSQYIREHMKYSHLRVRPTKATKGSGRTALEFALRKDRLYDNYKGVKP